MYSVMPLLYQSYGGGKQHVLWDAPVIPATQTICSTMEASSMYSGVFLLCQLQYYGGRQHVQWGAPVIPVVVQWRPITCIVGCPCYTSCSTMEASSMYSGVSLLYQLQYYGGQQHVQWDAPVVPAVVLWRPVACIVECPCYTSCSTGMLQQAVVSIYLARLPGHLFRTYQRPAPVPTPFLSCVYFPPNTWCFCTYISTTICLQPLICISLGQFTYKPL